MRKSGVNIMMFVVAGMMTAVSIVNAQTGWVWGKSYGGGFNEIGYATATDVNGNVLATGVYTSTTLSIGSTTLTCAGSQDVFVSKSDPSGNPLWAISIGGSGQERALSIKTDAAGNIYIGGHFASPSLDVAGSITLTNNGQSDIFVIKLDSDGAVLWAKSAGSTGDDFGYSLAVDATGNVYVTGTFFGTSLTFGSTTLSSIAWDIFLVKYDTDGNVQWARKQDGFGSYNEEAYAVATDASGNVIIGGSITGTVKFDSTVLFGSIYTLSFLVKFDTNGNVLWAKQATGESNSIFSITTDVNDNIFVSGRFIGTHPNPSLTPVTIIDGDTLPAFGDQDIFIAKYNSTGDVQWAKSYGGSANDQSGESGPGYFYGETIAADAQGDVYICGSSQSPVINFGTVALNNGLTGGIFVAKINGTNGDGIWGNIAYSGSGQSCYGISLDADENAYVTGWFNGNAMTFGSITTNKQGANDDIFIAKVSGGITSVSTNQKRTQALDIYPNPANGFVTVSNVPTGSVLSIMDVTGKVVYNTLSSDLQTTISTENLVNGIYFIRVENKTGVVNKKVVVNR